MKPARCKRRQRRPRRGESAVPALSTLYPAIEPYASGFLRPDSRHAVYWEECGNPAGVPVIFLHGGPGAGCSPRQRRFFDPQYYRILLMDQRGAGRSIPHGDIVDNTPGHLVADLELLRLERQIKAWHIFGGSWGSTLALAYGQAHPEVCLSFTLRGIYLLRACETQWFFSGVRRFVPEASQAFHDFLPPELRIDPAEGYWRQLNHPDEVVRVAAANSWSRYESSCLGPRSAAKPGGDIHDPQMAIALARLEAHYMRSNGFDPDDKLLRDVSCIQHLPCTIVHGRHDLLCPPANAFDLHRAWPGSELRIIEDAGHSAWEPETLAALIDAMDRRRY